MKRSHEQPETEDAEGLVDKRFKQTENATGDVMMTIRVLVSQKDGGSIIGKGGANIKRIRETTGADVKLAEPPANSGRRVCSASGTLPQVAAALSALVEVLCTDQQTADDASAVPGQFTITLLVGNEVIGACLGKQGAVIRETRDTTGAHIKVSQQTLDGSTEKTVDVKGSQAAVAMAIDMMVHQISTMGHRDGMVPLPRSEWTGPRPFAAASAYMAPFDPNAGPYGHMGQPQQQYGATNYGAAAGAAYGGAGFPPHYPPPPGPPPPFGAEKRQVVIPVANALVGSLIGKSGLTIRRIRDTSRAEVRIADMTPGVDQRNVTITGTESTTQVAVNMIYEALGQPSPLQANQGYYGAQYPGTDQAQQAYY